MRALIPLGLVPILGGLLLTGCIFNPKEENKPPVDPPVPYDRTSIQNLIEGFFPTAQSDPLRAIDDYEEALHSDFTFTFIASDAAVIREGDPTFPGFWTKEEDVGATSRMFERALRVQMTMTIDQELGSEPCVPGQPGTCYLYEVKVNLEVDVDQSAEHPNDPILTYLVEGLSTMAITEDPTPGFEGQWVIYQITDRTNELGLAPPIVSGGIEGAPSAQTMSWGAIRHLLQEVSAPE